MKQPPLKRFFRKFSFFWGITLLLALRLWYFGPEIDAPHDWRQCDTAYYILDFYQNGIDLLHPAVCWMGASDTLALEFPLPEAIVALAYRIFGESIPLARLIFLCFFAGALYYFYKTAERLFGRETARWAALVYLALPLGIFYSRAIHIDFSALLAAHAMVYYFLSGVEKKRRACLWLSGLAAALAFVIKAPYAFYFVLPMAWFAVQQKAAGWTLRTAAGPYLLALGCFWLWQQHVNAVNGAAPDLSYILHYRKMTQSAGWYFGTLEQRLSLYPWWILLQRGVLEAAGIGGIVFFLLGWRSLRQLPNLRFLLLWMLGLAAYVLIFFNLNFVHNYYQLPLLAPLAILCARGLQAAARQPAQQCVFFGLLAAANVAYAGRVYFKISAEHVEIGQLIRQHTPAQALVVATYQNLDCRNPKILYRARRRGWSVEEAALRPELIERLRAEQGARYWAYAGAALPAQMQAYAASLPPPRVFQMNSIPEKLYLFQLPAKEISGG